MIHPARKMAFEELYNDLCLAAQEGLIYEHVGSGELSSLRLYTYSDETVYSRSWSGIALMARGLILDVDARVVVATPFPKFFNVQECGIESMQWLSVPNLPFQCFEKLDGSLIIIYWYGGRWRCATKGSLSSEQAKWAEEWLYAQPEHLKELRPGWTYLYEAIYPSNKIVVNYGNTSELVMLGAYKENGEEVHIDVSNIPGKIPFHCNIVKRHDYDSISELLELAGRLDCNSEGFVLRFTDGTRLKIKGEEYCRIHRLISGLTPLGVWRAMCDDASGCGVEEMRRQLPEEFLADFDTIVELLSGKLAHIIAQVDMFAISAAEMTDKEVGLSLKELPPLVAKFIFHHRKHDGDLLSDGRSRRALFENIRPDRNVLSGYRASSVMSRVLDGGE